MPLSNKQLDDLSEADIRALMDAEVREGKRIDYKAELPGKSDGEKREFVHDLSSFANAVGGYLVFGVQEDGGLPTDIVGLSAFDQDADILRLEQTARANLSPAIPGLRFKVVPIEDGNPVLVISIPRSWRAPHMAVLKGSTRFFSRGARGKYLIEDVAELRPLFGAAEAASDRVRRFRDRQLGRIVAGDLPTTLADSGRLVLHLVPFGSGGQQEPVDIRSLYGQSERVRPLNSWGMSQRFNIDGLLATTGDRDQSTSYMQLFRSGAIEAVVSRSLIFENETGAFIRGQLVEQEVVTGVRRYLRTQRGLGVDPPVVVFLGLVGVEGFLIATEVPLQRGTHPIDRDLVECPEVVVVDWDNDIPTVLRPAFDTLWNASGRAGSPFYDDEGNWTL